MSFFSIFARCLRTTAFFEIGKLSCATSKYASLYATEYPYPELKKASMSSMIVKFLFVVTPLVSNVAPSGVFIVN